MTRFFRATVVVSALVLSACVDRSSAPLTAPGRNAGVQLHNGGTAAAVVAFDLIQQPATDVFSGEVLGGPPIVFALTDDFAEASVTASLVGASAGMVLSGTTTLVTAGGLATFDNLIITGAGTASLQFTAGGLSVTSGPITVTDFGGGGGEGPKYTWEGFFKPIDNDKVNKNEAGSTIPVKFRLVGESKADIFANDSPSSQQVSCTDWTTPLGPLTPIVSKRSPALIIDDGGRYQIDWKREKGWANTCRVLHVSLNDLSPEHTAKFDFRKDDKDDKSNKDDKEKKDKK